MYQFYQILVHVGGVGRLCISIIFYWRRKLKNPEKPLTHDKLLTKFITFVCIEYTSQYAVIQLTALVVIGTDFIGTCRWKFNYHMITARRRQLMWCRSNNWFQQQHKMLAPIYEKQYSNFIEIAFYDQDISCSSIFIYLFFFIDAFN